MKLNLSFLLLLVVPALVMADYNIKVYCERGYMFTAQDTKCSPYKHSSRLARTPVRGGTAGCYELCKNNSDCKSFSYGEEDVENPEWEDLCLLCSSEEENLQGQVGFVTYSMIRD